MRDFFVSLGEKPYRGDQVFQWIHQHGVQEIGAFRNIGKALMATLSEKATIAFPEVITSHTAADGTTKWLFRLSCGNSIETVFIPEKTRGTLCVSSQVGCGLNCSFCATGKQGFNRDLKVSEIIGQVYNASRLLKETSETNHRKITNVVMMGMGEPLLNFDAVVDAMDIMMDDFGYGLSKRRVTLSTSGLVPDMVRLREVSPVALAVSLHAPEDALRNILVPINKKYPLAELMAVCRTYFKDEPRRKITFEYVMLKDVNDSRAHAKALVRLLENVPAKVNLIPFNTFPGTEYQCSEWPVIDVFQKILMAHDIHTTVRKTRGDDIDAACGQLAGKFKDRTSRSRLIAKRNSATRAAT